MTEADQGYLFCWAKNISGHQSWSWDIPIYRYPTIVTNVTQYMIGTLVFQKQEVFKIFHEKMMKYKVSAGLTKLGPILRKNFFKNG